MIVALRFIQLSLLLANVCLFLKITALMPMRLGMSSDADFCASLPKIECHAHLTGSIPYPTIQALHADALNRHPDLGECPHPASHDNLISFFKLFEEMLYKILDTPQAVKISTAAVLDFFRRDNCMYLELRTSPRVLGPVANSDDEFKDYMDALYEALEDHKNDRMIVRLILSVRWNHSPEKVRRIVDLALAHMDRSTPVVGIDISGDPRQSPYFYGIVNEIKRAKDLGLKLTIHFAEIPEKKTLFYEQLKTLDPNRLGHATYSIEVRREIIRKKLPIEVCITSNIRAQTVPSLEAHHIRWAVENKLPVLISTDDTLVFETTLSREYELALNVFGGDRQRLVSILEGGIDHVFGTDSDKAYLRKRLRSFQKRNF